MSRILHVLGFAFSEDKTNVVLIRKNRPEWQAGLLNGVGGKLDRELDEGYDGCMVREFFEETGVKVKNWQCYCILRSPEAVVHVFKAVCDLDQVVTKKDEKIEIIAVDSLMIHSMVEDLKWLIPMALDERHDFSLTSERKRIGVKS